MREKTHKPARDVEEMGGGDWLLVLGDGVPAVPDHAGTGWGGTSLCYLWGTLGAAWLGPRPALGGCGSLIRVSSRRGAFGAARGPTCGVGAGSGTTSQLMCCLHGLAASAIMPGHPAVALVGMARAVLTSSFSFSHPKPELTFTSVLDMNLDAVCKAFLI